MKFRGAFIGLAVTVGGFCSMAACTSDDGIGLTVSDAGPTSPDGNVADVTTNADGGVIVPTEASTPKDGSVPDATIPAACNDGKVDLGETCDPLESCPTACPPIACQLRSLDNGGTCAASCSNIALQSQCINGDGCCPPECNTTNDTDCTTGVCGNNILESGETCDGTAVGCPTSCPPIGCQNRKLMNAGTCTATCVDDTTKITTCTSNDKCCPATCTPATDGDCAAGVCGNGTLDVPGETCDPGDLAHPCPEKCPPLAGDLCQLRKLDNGGTCQAACSNDAKITKCINGDGCCAPGCDHTQDNDCAPVCGNGVTEPPGETCDGASCPTAASCLPQGCQLYTVKNAGTCTATCEPSTLQTTCIDGDGCCPGGCTNVTDKDCPVNITCPNGMLDPGETCDNVDGTCPQSCVPTKTTGACIGPTGSAATCNLACDQPILSCSNLTNDSCCPFVTKRGISTGSCTTKTDVDCLADTWKVATLSTLGLLKAGECDSVTFDNIDQGGSYAFTTCTPKGTKVTAEGNVQIKSITANTRFSLAGGSNEDCLSKTSIPALAGWDCSNTDGAKTMACASDTPGGIIAKTSSAMTVTFCAVGAEGTAFPISVFYNAVNAPKTGLIKLP